MIYSLMAGIGFAGGALYYGDDQGGAPAGGGPGRSRSLEDWAAAQPGATAVSGEKPSRDGFEVAMRSKRGGLGSAMRAHLQLVSDAPVGDLPELLLRYERTMPGDDSESVGGLVRAAIVERLLAENPDGLLKLALGGRSEYIESNRGNVVGGLREQMGYEGLQRKIAGGGIPAVKSRLMQALLCLEINADPERGWERALENGRVDLASLAEENPSAEVIDRIILGDSPHRLSDRVIQQCFATLSIDDSASVASVLQMVDSIGQAGERLAAISGLGGAPREGSSQAQWESIADGLRSDQERLVFYQGAFSAGSIGPFAGAKLRADNLEKIEQIKQPSVRQALLDEQLRAWKASEAEEARAWAEDHGQLERYESLQVVAFPVMPMIFDPSDLGAEYDPPEIPADFPFTPPCVGDDDKE